jgi:hypothetical protein
LRKPFNVLVAFFAVACNAGASVSTREDGLTVGGYYCPQGAGDTQSNIPADDVFYISTFEGGGPMSCHAAAADGTSLYIADRDRWPCDSHVRITDPFPTSSSGRATYQSCVALVSDRGPNICVEKAAGKAMIDASPAITAHLFGIQQSGWSDHREVVAQLTTDALGCGWITDLYPSDAGAAVLLDDGGLDGGEVVTTVSCQSDLDCRYWEYCDSTGTCVGLSCGADDTACNAGLPGLGVVCGDAGLCTPGCHSDYDCLDSQSCDASSGDGECK